MKLPKPGMSAPMIQYAALIARAVQRILSMAAEFR